MKALVKVGYGCNHRCTFCHSLDRRGEEGSASEVDARIDRAASLGCTAVVFSGGEATTRPELVHWAARARSLGLGVGLVTNGRMLSYRALVDRLCALGLEYVYLSLHGGTASVHDPIVRARGFDETVRALGNLSGRGLDLTVNTVVTRQNVEHLRGVAEALAPYPDAAGKYSLVQAKGGGARAFDLLAPDLARAADRVLDALTHGRSLGRPRQAHEGFPLCLLPGFEDRYDDLRTHGFGFMAEVGEEDFSPVDDGDRAHPEACRGCALAGRCPGLDRGYLPRVGDGVLRAVTGRPRANSFDFTFERVVGTLEGGCPVRRDGVTPWDRARVVFLSQGGRVARYRTDTRDLTERELVTARWTHGQLYVDASRGPAPEDFSRDLRALARSEECVSCPSREACPGLFEVCPGDPFARDDARVREVIASLRGLVLDVGCGDGRYGDLLAPWMERGEVTYVGLDPEVDRVRALASRWPRAELHGCALEDFRDDRTWDHVLVLRSWNHLREPGAVRALAERSLRAGGTLTVADNVAFGLLRTKGQQALARRSTARWEHHRNDGADEAHEALAAPWLALEVREDTRPGTSNQWLLRYRRRHTGEARDPADKGAPVEVG